MSDKTLQRDSFKQYAQCIFLSYWSSFLSFSKIIVVILYRAVHYAVDFILVKIKMRA